MADASQVWTDCAKAIEGLDMTAEAQNLLMAMAKLKVPGVDMDMLVASQLRNLAALGASNRAALEGMKAVGKWQEKVLQETMKELSAAASGFAKVGAPQQMVEIEGELFKTAFETAVRDMQEFAEIVTKANREAMEALAERIPKSLDEIKRVLKGPMPPRTE